MKILMIGNQESGKTTYMASAYGMLESGVEGFHIRTDEDTSRLYGKLFRAIKSGSYPLASDKRKLHSFDLYHNTKNVLHFDWIDYNGGIVNTLDADELMNDIDTSDGLMLFFEAKALLEQKNSVHRMRRILSLISQKLATVEAPLFTVIIVITKVDQLGTADEYEQAIIPLRRFIENTKGNNKIYARIIPVSCTSKGLYNTELPLLDMLDSGLRLARQTAANSAVEHNEKAKSWYAQRGIFDWVFSRLQGLPTNVEMAESQWQKAKEQVELYKTLEKPMNKLGDYVSSYEVLLPVGINHSNERSKKASRIVRF